MKLKYSAILLTFVGLGLQAAGIIIAVLAFNQNLSFPITVETMLPIAVEINLIIGAVIFLLGTVFIMFPLESKAIDAGRKCAVALLGFISPFGIITALKLKERTIQKSAGKEQLPIKKACLVGSVFTIVVTIFFLWEGYQWLQRNNFPPKLSTGQKKSNETLAFKRLKQIYEAQQKYILKDWDGDGQKNYAQFLAHLWQSVDSNADPVRVNLLPREIAFAMRRPFAVDGYIYVDMHYSYKVLKGEDGSLVSVEENEIDPNTGFAVCAFPASNKETGLLTLIITQKGDIYAKTLEHITYGPKIGLLPCPIDFAQEGWRQIPNISDLKKFQKELDYTEQPLSHEH
jgi:hypothetical protein